MSDDSLELSRRAMLAGLASAGLLGSGTAAADTDIGGGSMADQALNYRVKYYVGTFAERPEPGGQGRVWEVDDPGGQNHGAVYLDTGDSWQGPLDRKVRRLEAESLNNTRYPDAGEVQSAIDDLASIAEIGPEEGDVRGKVILDGTQLYQPSSEWTLKPGVDLVGPATVEPQGDHPALFCDNGTKFWGPIEVNIPSDTYSSSAVRLDASESTLGKYDDEHAVRGDLCVRGAGGSTSTGLELAADPDNDGTGNAISTGTWFNLELEALGTGVWARCGQEWINSVQMEGHTERCHDHFLHEGDSSVNGNFVSVFSGSSQTGSITNETIVNNQTTDGTSMHYVGMIWDVDAAETQRYCVGPNITFDLRDVGVANGSIRSDAGDGSDDQVIRAFKANGGQIRTFFLDSGLEYAMETASDFVKMMVNQSSVLGFDPSSPVTYSFNDLDMRSSRLHNLQNGGSGDLAIEFGGGAGLYVNSSGEVVVVDESGNETTIS